MSNNQEKKPEWYIIHTYSGYENLVKASLEQLITNNNLQDSIFDIKIPMETTIEEKNGKRKLVEKKLLPCYVFIKMIYSNQVWYLVTNTRGVTSFLGPQGRPLAMREDEVRKLQLESAPVCTDFKVGDIVNIDAGPLAGFEGGVITEVKDSLQRAKVRVVMFGQDTEVEIDFAQITKDKSEQNQVDSVDTEV